MKIFLDTADVAEIREYAATGLVDGVTTNPSLAAKTGRDYGDSLKEICSIISGSVSAEVLSTDFDGMMKEGKAVSKIAKNITIKVPSTWDGMRACRAFANDGLGSLDTGVREWVGLVAYWITGKTSEFFPGPDSRGG